MPELFGINRIRHQIGRTVGAEVREEVTGQLMVPLEHPNLGAGLQVDSMPPMMVDGVPTPQAPLRMCMFPLSACIERFPILRLPAGTQGPTGDRP